MQGRLIGAGIVVLVLVMVGIIFSPIATVDAGHRGIVTRFGKVLPETLEPGMSIISPLNTVHRINTQVQKVEVVGVAASKDLQQVHTTITVNYHLAADAVQRLYSEVGLEYETKIISPATQEALKAVTAQYTATELVEKRGDVKAKIQEALSNAVDKVSSKTVVVNEIFVTNFAFSNSYAHAIELKQTAEQNVLTQQRNLQVAQLQAQQRVAQAEGEAKAIAISAAAINSQGGAAYVNLEAIRKWNGTLPTMMMGGNAVPFVNIGK